MAAERRRDGASPQLRTASWIWPDELDAVRVLIVDDNADATEILRRWFEYVGAAVVTAPRSLYAA
jgi:hypothetical protein